jgi:uncharacterized OB-fold protein
MATVTTTIPAPMPQPAIDNWNKPFWDACAENRLTAQRCRTTGKTWFPPSPKSPFDIHAEWEWVDSKGRGTVLSWVVFHQKYFPGFGDRLPYNVAMVRLDEGFVLLSNIDAPNDSIRIGQRVAVKFEPRGAVNVPIFTPVD